MSHDKHFSEVLKHLSECGLQINYRKCVFAKSEIPFVGYILSEFGARPVASKVHDIVDFKSPTSVDSLRTFLGMASYYRKFVECFAIKAVPLYALLKKGADFLWSEDCEKAFVYIKEQLSNAKILCHPDFSKPFALQTYASNEGIGFVLSQEKDGMMQPIQFGGRVLKETESRYSVTDKELLAVFYVVKTCEVYLLGHSFIIYSDHKPLSYLKGFKDVVNKRFRWINHLEEIGAVVKYLPGKANVIADFLSRNIQNMQQAKKNVSMNAFTLESLHYYVPDLVSMQREDSDIQRVINYKSMAVAEKGVVAAAFRNCP